MKNFIKFCFLAMFAVVSIAMTSCRGVSCDADEEATLVEKPWFWGHGGVNEEAVGAGLKWCWASTHPVYFKTVPQRHDEVFDDIFSNDNTPLDFHTYITIQLKAGKSPILLQNYGEKWYENNLQVHYRNYTRDEVAKYSPFDLISNREVLARIDSVVTAKMNRLLAELSKEKEMPIVIKSVVTGAAKPNKDQLAEMNKTAQYVQARQTQERSREMEVARSAAERARAEADKAYQSAMGLSADQFIQLKYIEMIANKNGANIDVMVGPATSMWNVRR